MKHRGVCMLGCVPLNSGGALPLSRNVSGEKMDGEHQ
jgi:hypothetical protein